MPRLVVYLRSSFCPDVARWQRWVSRHPLDYVALDIDSDDEAYRKVIEWTGHESVPTLVIAPDGGLDPIEAPAPLPRGTGPRGVDRGTMLSEPDGSQIGSFLDRHAIAYGGGPATAGAGDTGARRPWWRFF